MSKLPMSNTLEYHVPSPRRLTRPDIAYIIPMGIFMGFTFFGGTYKSFYPLSYVLKTILVAIALFALWNYFTRIRWTHLGLGALVGVVGVFQWIGMEKLFMSHPWLSWTHFGGDLRESAFRPYEFFKDSPALMWAFITIRWAGASLVVPVMEELFWRDFAWRTIASPNDFQLEPVATFDRNAFLIVPLIFATVHPQWLTAIVWALLIGWLLVKTKSLGACIVAHGVTNFLLGAYVLYSHHVWKLPREMDEWFFW
ncbi:MAG: CAAX prenyl protease-related protein [Burkholderiales bacterium]|nr:CAAX prenyl protease-related protein [Phycisphaerae bacterium]